MKKKINSVRSQRIPDTLRPRLDCILWILTKEAFEVLVII
jgi:hypothetical protein